MLVHLHQYREDDAKETVRSEGDVDPEMDADDYFDADELEADQGWERISRGDETLLRRMVSYEKVAAVSLPQENLEETDDELPGDDLQLRRGGDTEYVKRAVVVEAIDEDPE